VHAGLTPYLMRISCPKVRCVHPSKWPFWLRTLVPQKTLVCIRFRNDPCVHLFFKVTKNHRLDPSPNIRNFGFYYRNFTTAIGSTIQPLSMRGYTIDRNHSSCKLNLNHVCGEGHPFLQTPGSKNQSFGCSDPNVGF